MDVPTYRMNRVQVVPDTDGLFAVQRETNGSRWLIVRLFHTAMGAPYWHIYDGSHSKSSAMATARALFRGEEPRR